MAEKQLPASPAGAAGAASASTPPSPPPPRPRNPPAPPATLLFHGLSAVKVKTVALHPVQPWALTSDEHGRIVHWDYKHSRVVSAYHVLALAEASDYASSGGGGGGGGGGGDGGGGDDDGGGGDKPDRSDLRKKRVVT